VIISFHEILKIFKNKNDGLLKLNIVMQNYLRKRKKENLKNLFKLFVLYTNINNNDFKQFILNDPLFKIKECLQIFSTFIVIILLQHYISET